MVAFQSEVSYDSRISISIWSQCDILTAIIDWHEINSWQIGSSTWATHLLKMNEIAIFRKTPIHIVTRKRFPPLLGQKKKEFLKTAEALIVARDPFQRLLSSFTVKLVAALNCSSNSASSPRTSSTLPTGPTCRPGHHLVKLRESSGTSTGRRRGTGHYPPSGSSSGSWWGAP